MDGKVSMVFNRNCFPKMTDFSWLGALQAVTYTLKVVVSKKWHEIDTLLLHTTNKKYHMAYLFVPFPMTLDDPEGHSPNAGLIKCNSTNICATFSTVLTVTARRAVTSSGQTPRIPRTVYRYFWAHPFFHFLVFLFSHILVVGFMQ